MRGGRSPRAEESEESRIEELESRLADRAAEAEAVKRSFRSALATKDEEIEILRRMTVEQQEAYERAAELKVEKRVKRARKKAEARVHKAAKKGGHRTRAQRLTFPFF